MRLRLLTLLCALSLSPIAAQTTAGSGKTNVLLIIADDLNTSLGCYGHPTVKSPNIDRLAARGVLFERAYCQFPLCNPSRTSFLSGLRPQTTRVFDNETVPRSRLKEAVFLPQHFRAQGYFTARADKILHVTQGGQVNMDDPSCWSAVEELAASYYPEKQQLKNHIVRSGRLWAELNAPDEATGDGVAARRIVSWIEQAAAERKPFFLAAGFRKPHANYVAPRRYFDLYSNAQIQLPQEPPEHLEKIPPAAFTYRRGMQPVPEAERREHVAAYYSSISFMDAQVGLLLAALDRLNLWQNTVVVFMGDHGYHLGEHGGMWHKQSLFEESARAPLIIAAPFGSKGKSCARIVEFVDLYPTLLELCRLPSPGTLHGKSLAPLLKAPGSSRKDPAYTMVMRGEIRGESVRTERFRYTEWDQGKAGSELYDHASDPREYRNLASDASHSKVVAEMKGLLQRLR